MCSLAQPLRPQFWASAISPGKPGACWVWGGGAAKRASCHLQQAVPSHRLPGGAGAVTPQSGPCRGQWGGASGAKRGSGLTLQQLRVAPVFPAVLLTRTSRGAPSAAPDSTEGPCGGQREAGGGRRKPAWGALGGPERKETQDPGAKRALSAVETVGGHGLALPRNPEGEGEGGRRARKTRPWDRTTGSSRCREFKGHGP